jgi:2-dehydro-3-deoxyphosphogluconate aldolase / (4S)-4-hydroxy-2-oxoglutarate aldolase
MNTLSHILEDKIVAIIRNVNPKDIIKISEALYAGGIRILEITMNSTQPLKAIEEVVENLGDKMVIGAGTVLDPETARLAIISGAKFILSPTVNIKTIKMAKRYGVVCIPGAYTPTEILYAYSNGGDIIKVFPATSPSYLKAILGPLPQIPLLPTGGINIDNIRDFQKAGAVGFGIGSALVDSKMIITEESLMALTKKAKLYVDAVSNSKIH